MKFVPGYSMSKSEIVPNNVKFHFLQSYKFFLIVRETRHVKTHKILRFQSSSFTNTLQSAGLIFLSEGDQLHLINFLNFCVKTFIVNWLTSV